MAEITIKGNPVHTSGDLPSVGSKAPDFTLVKSDLSEASLSDFSGKNVILNIFPSIDTAVCATSTRKFNEEASKLDNSVVLCISMDLPFATARFCSTEGIENVETLSGFRDNYDFARKYGIETIDGPFKGLFARSVVVVGEDGNVKYTQLVGETADEPDYEKAISSI